MVFGSNSDTMSLGGGVVFSNIVIIKSMTHTYHVRSFSLIRSYWCYDETKKTLLSINNTVPHITKDDNLINYLILGGVPQ